METVEIPVRKFIETLGELEKLYPPRRREPLQRLRTIAEREGTINVSDIIKNFVEAGYDARVVLEFLVNVGAVRDVTTIRRAVEQYVFRVLYGGGEEEGEG